MGIFKSPEEKEKERKYKEAVRRIIIWPESKSEYQIFKGYEVEVVDTGREDKGVYIRAANRAEISNLELRNHLMYNGVEAIVNAQYWYAEVGKRVDFVGEGYYGLPVRKKKER